MDSYITVKEASSFTFEDRKSKFYGFCAPVRTEEEAVAFINAVKKKYPDARHWVYAYVLRENNATRFTDDREPQGTAGMPVLDVIRKNGCTDVVIVVVRYFGGILLGTGGLVHAYTEAALGALKNASIIRYSVYASISATFTYSDYQKVIPLLDSCDFKTEDVEYLDVVTVFGNLPCEKRPELEEKVAEATSARAEIILIDEKYCYRE